LNQRQKRKPPLKTAPKLPRISIVTPSFNQGQFLEETMRSVLEQGYPDLEYVVMDGGSSDNSAQIIRKYAQQLTYWTSGKDQGHYDAIVRGFAHTSGEIMAWINSDDKYAPWAFSVVAEIFSSFPEVEWLTTSYPLRWDRHGRAVNCAYVGGFNQRTFLMGANLPQGRWHVGPFIQQESTFWRRSLWERTGGTIDNRSIAGDFELWARFFAKTSLHTVQVPLSGFRVHGNQISVQRQHEYLAAAEEILVRHGGRRAGFLHRLSRATLHQAFGGRPLHTMPRPLARLLVGSGLLHSAPTCRWQDEGWQQLENYIF
jgi:Glycosyl transferase family 2